MALGASQGKKDLWDFMGGESLCWGMQQEQLKGPPGQGTLGTKAAQKME